MFKDSTNKFYRSIIIAFLFCGFTFSIFLPLVNLSDQDNNPEINLKASPESNFVYTEGTRFMLNGQPFYFAGTNNYYLGYVSNFMVDNVFEDMVAMNLKVVRTWGFIDVGTLNPDGSLSDNVDGEGHKNGVYYHYWDPDANAPAINEGENGLQNLDYVIYNAANYGIKLIIPFVNYWSDMGGMEQYARWIGLSDKEEFYTNSILKQYYKDYISALLNRENTYTGIQYKNDPTIFAWQLANEPRCPGDTSGNTIVNWATEMSAHIKSIDPDHLVSIGDEGFYNDPNNNDYPYTDYEGGDWPREIEISTIDYGTVHLYPDHWGFSSNPSWGTQWIIDHALISQQANKPMVLGEFGWQDRSTRDAVYTEWFQAIEDYDVAGDTYWILAGLTDSGSAYADYDGFTVYWDADLSTQSTAFIIRDHAIRMEQKNSGIFDNDPPTTPTGLTATVISSTQINIDWNNNPESDLANYRVYRSTSTTGTYTLISQPTSSSYSDTGLNPGTTYYYRLSAVDTSGNQSPQTSYVSATTPAPSPGDYEPITIPFEYSGSGEFFWMSNTLGTYINSWNLQTLTVNDVDFTNTYVSAANLPAKIDGYYYIHYVGNYRWSHFEVVGTAPEPPEPEPPEPEPDIEPPGTPTSLTATATSTSQINLNWNNNPESDLANYRVYRSNSATGTYSFLGQTTSSDYSDTGLSAETTYYYRVSAVDASGNESPQTSYVSATTQSGPEPEPPEPEPEPEPPSGDYQSISTPFTYDGAGEFYWVTDNIDNFINSWNLALLEINGVDYTNTFVSASNLPAKIDGYYYIHYVGNYGWSHIEIR